VFESPLGHHYFNELDAGSDLLGGVVLRGCCVRGPLVPPERPSPAMACRWPRLPGLGAHAEAGRISGSAMSGIRQ
jgi:hypothetical protein